MPLLSNTQYPYARPDTVIVIQEQRFEELRPYIRYLCEHPEEPDACAHTFVQLMSNPTIPGDILCQLLEHFKLSTDSIQYLAHAPQLKKNVYEHLENLEATPTHLTLLKKCIDKTTVIGQFFHEKTNKLDFWTTAPKTLEKIQTLITNMEAMLQAYETAASQNTEANTQALALLVQTLPSEPESVTPSQVTAAPDLLAQNATTPPPAAEKMALSRNLVYLIAFMVIPVTYLLLSQTGEEAIVKNQPSP